MSTLREYRMPLFVAGGALVVAIIIWVALIAPQNTKLSSLQNQQTQLQAQEQQLQARLTALQSEGQKLSSNCADLQKISTQIPSVQSPTDVDAEESSFESQFNDLAGTSGVTLAQFSGFAPATSTSATPSSTAATPTSTVGVTAVPTTLTVQGNYGQVTAFVNGLDSFPRLFVIQKFVLASGTAASSGAGAAAAANASSGASAGAGAGAAATPLWVGGQATPASAGPYNLQITGSIYYTSTPNALSTCTKATAAQSSLK
jgi:Tfp pilus assembly protein PilO